MRSHNSSRSRALAKIGLLGTVSLLSLAGASDALAQGREVVITGSLIGGTSAVGVPITGLSDEQFLESGAVTISDVMRTLPNVQVSISGVATAAGGTIQRPQEVAIHNLTTGAGSETLLMINGMRFPIQGFSAEYVDPSIVPALAVDRIDVLAEGASATYGSDAVAGVVNVILRRGFDGAISQVQFGRSWDIGADKWTTAQLYGKTWDSGQITVTGEWQHEDEVHGQQRPYWTANFEPFGYDDRRVSSSSMPASMSVGAPTTYPALAALGFDRRTGARACSNCFSLPEGVGWDFGTQPAGPTTTWATIQSNPGMKNLRDTHELADMLPASEHTSVAGTFDQILADDLFGNGAVRNLNLFVDGVWSHRRSKFFYIPGASPGRELLLREVRPPKATYPYYPEGAPSGLRVNYNLGYEHPVRVGTGDISLRGAAGLEADFSFNNWHMRTYYARSEVRNWVHANNMVNSGNVNMAIGAAAGKPADVPYLNIFCDARVYQCNSPATLDFITGYRHYDQTYNTNEYAAIFDGDLFMLPGGPVRAAIGGNYVESFYHRKDINNYDTPSTADFEVADESADYDAKAFFAQINIPLVGQGNAMPMVEAFEVEGAIRYDKYGGDIGDHSVWTPKVAATWTIGNGFSLRGTWGKAFRAPGVGEFSYYAVQIQPLNAAAGGDNEFEVDCFGGSHSSQGTASPGSLTGALNPSCADGFFPGGITTAGGAGGANAIRGGLALDPEKANNWSIGFNFAPTEMFSSIDLTGLNIDFSLYNLKVDNLLDAKWAGDNVNDSRLIVCTSPSPDCNYLVRANPGALITDPSNSAFYAAARELAEHPRSVVNENNLEGIQFIEDLSITNLGYRKISGIDFNSRYDFPLANFGFLNIGWTGNYQLKDRSRILAGERETDNFEGNTGGRFRWRGRLGWAGMGGLEGFSVTTFVNHIPHTGPAEDQPPNCYWASGFSAGSCYAGAPYWGPHEIPEIYAPALYTVDLNVQYNTGEMFANEYLHNINFQFNVLNLLNKAPPFNYEISSGRAEAAWEQETISPLQRYVTFAITKIW